MAKQIIQYTLNEDWSIPDYVEDGWYFEYEWLLMWISKDVELPEWVVVVTEERMRSIMTTLKLTKTVEVELSQPEKMDLVDDFLLKLN